MPILEPDPIPWLPLGPADAARIARDAGAVLARVPWVQACWLHGSLVRGDRPPRDIDFGIVTSRRAISLVQWDDARCAVAEALRVDPDVIDLRAVDDASPVFLHQMLKHGVLCCEPDHAARIAFEVRAMSLWCDFAPVWQRQRDAAIAAWSAGQAPMVESR